MSELDKQLCSLAEDYIENSYYRVGNCSYAWEEKDYRSNDLDGDIVCGECPPSDADHYSWWEIVFCEIESSEIDDRNDETGEYSVPGFLTKLEEIGVKNCQNVYCKRIPAALLYDPK